MARLQEGERWQLEEMFWIPQDRSTRVRLEREEEQQEEEMTEEERREMVETFLDLPDL